MHDIASARGNRRLYASPSQIVDLNFFALSGWEQVRHGGSAMKFGGGFKMATVNIPDYGIIPPNVTFPATTQGGPGNLPCP